MKKFLIIFYSGNQEVIWADDWIHLVAGLDMDGVMSIVRIHVNDK